MQIFFSGNLTAETAATRGDENRAAELTSLMSPDEAFAAGVLGNILGFIADTLHPHGFEAIKKNNFAAVRAMPPL